MTRTHVYLSPEILARIDTIVGPQGRSKFIRQAVGQLLDGLAPMTDNTDPPYLEYDSAG